MPKKYNTPHRSMTVKTRLTKEEYATFAEVATLCGVSKAAFIRKAITGALLKPTIVITSVNDELLKKLDDLIAQYGKIGGNLRAASLKPFDRTMNCAAARPCGTLLFVCSRYQFGAFSPL